MTREASHLNRETESAEEFIPPTQSLKVLAQAAEGCHGCELYRRATQVVFGVGMRTSRLFLIGEQPGDQEDRAGLPFVGPAGQLLDVCLKEVAIDRQEVYLTNAVKHFKFEERGKRRLHQKPGIREVRACHPWLERELEIVHPEVVVCLGATAAQAVLGSKIRVTIDRGRKLASEWCENTFVTIHPSAILRAPDSLSRERMRSEFIKDLKLAISYLSVE